MTLQRLAEVVHGVGMVSTGFQYAEVVLVAGAGSQALPKSGMGVLASNRILAGGALGHLTCSVTGTTLNISSSSGTDTSTVGVLLTGE